MRQSKVKAKNALTAQDLTTGRRVFEPVFVFHKLSIYTVFYQKYKSNITVSFASKRRLIVNNVLFGALKFCKFKICYIYKCNEFKAKIKRCSDSNVSAFQLEIQIWRFLRVDQ